MVEQWSPKPKVKGSNPFSPEKSPVFGLFQLQRVKEKLEDVMIELFELFVKKAIILQFIFKRRNCSFVKQQKMNFFLKKKSLIKK